MKLLFLGTGSDTAKDMSETDIQGGTRRCTSMLIDDSVVVDLGPQSFDFATKLGAKTDTVTDVFLSHTHRDHYVKRVLLDYAAAAKGRLNVWCHKGAVARLKLTDEEAERVNICPVEVMDQWETAGMTVIALPANHMVRDSAEQPLHYIFAKDGKKLFYGLDGGWFRTETWEHMRHNEVLDAMILEATVGDLTVTHGIGFHNTLPMLQLMLEALFDNGMVKKNAILIGSHFNEIRYRAPKETLLGELGMIPAYDGFTIEI